MKRNNRQALLCPADPCCAQGRMHDSRTAVLILRFDTSCFKGRAGCRHSLQSWNSPLQPAVSQRNAFSRVCYRAEGAFKRVMQCSGCSAGARQCCLASDWRSRTCAVMMPVWRVWPGWKCQSWSRCCWHTGTRELTPLATQMPDGTACGCTACRLSCTHQGSLSSSASHLEKRLWGMGAQAEMAILGVLGSDSCIQLHSGTMHVSAACCRLAASIEGSGHAASLPCPAWAAFVCVFGTLVKQQADSGCRAQVCGVAVQPPAALRGVAGGPGCPGHATAAQMGAW